MRVAIALALGIASASSAGAETLFRCGASSGYAFALPGGLVPLEDSGWVEDGISGGEILLIRSGDVADIVYQDAAGSRSAKADGGTIVQLGISSTDAILIVVYPLSVETYHFTEKMGRRQVVWTQNKHSAPIEKAAAFQAFCK